MIDDVAHVMHIKQSAIAVHNAGRGFPPEERIATAGLDVASISC